MASSQGFCAHHLRADGARFAPSVSGQDVEERSGGTDLFGLFAQRPYVYRRCCTLLPCSDWGAGFNANSLERCQSESRPYALYGFKHSAPPRQSQAMGRLLAIGKIVRECNPKSYCLISSGLLDPRMGWRKAASLLALARELPVADAIRLATIERMTVPLLAAGSSMAAL